MKFRPSTAEHDFQVRKNQIIRFLSEGYKVKAMIFHRGREMAHLDFATQNMQAFVDQLGEVGTVERGPHREGRRMMLLLTPKKKSS